MLLITRVNTYGQTDIFGTINHYTSVTSVSVPCNSVTVSSIANLSFGDKVLIIQMKGAAVDETNGVAYGNINSINNAGNYEFNEIAGFTGLEVHLKYTFAKTYTNTGFVQLIRIPQYPTGANVTGTLTAQPWNGSTGGVLVFETPGIVTMNANIDVSETGFRGGVKSVAGGACTFLSAAVNGYAYPISIDAGGKGEGAAVTTQAGGKGKQLNGGGGGNNHNCGGGGGANYGNGGQGGNKSNGCAGTYPSNPGIGGLGFSTAYYSNLSNRIFMGGGGGGGHQNNAFSLDGGSGGGIIIIRASAIVNTGAYKIMANGKSLTIYDPGDSGDGSGGGGAGGTILLAAASFSSLTIEAIGGKGADTYYPTRNFGPGGGGGGGVVWVSNPVFPTAPDITAFVNGGSHGFSKGVTLTEAWASTDGIAGAQLPGLTIPQNPTVFATPCIATPVSLLGFSGKQVNNRICLDWSTISEINNDHFVIEKSLDGINYYLLKSFNGEGNSNSLTTYLCADNLPVIGLNYYRLKQYDFDGKESIIGHVIVNFSGAGEIIEKVYPNPFADELIIQSSMIIEESFTDIKLVNLLGIESNSIYYQFEGPTIKINTTELDKGLYYLQVVYKDKIETRKVIKD